MSSHHAFFYTGNGDLVLVAATRSSTYGSRHFSSDTASSNVSDIYVSQDYIVTSYHDGTVTLQVIASMESVQDEPAIAVVSQAMRHCLMILREIESGLRVRYGRRVIRLDVGKLFSAMLVCGATYCLLLTAQVAVARVVHGWPKWRHPP